MSSAAAVSKVKRIVGISCGHMGTLDPLASGVLPVAFGNASRLFNYLLDKKKTYRAVFRFGIDTDTLDSTGTILHEGGYIPDFAEIKDSLRFFVGKIEQVPPAFSAKSIGGVRAYHLARQGKEVALTAKRVSIYSIQLTARLSENEFEFLIVCGGGTYIRSLARDIAAKCNTCAVMTALVRERSGVFDLKDSVSPEMLMLNAENWQDFAVPPDAVFDMPAVDVSDRDAVKLRNGLKTACSYADGEYKLYLNGEFYGIAQADAGLLRAKVKLV